MDPDVCREHLAKLLTEEATLLGELEALLTEEQAVIGSKDVEALQRTTQARQERVGALARVEEQRRSLCSMHGQSPDMTGLERLMAWCDANGSLMSRLRDCAERALRCRDLNDRNGMMVAARLKQVEGLLGALTGRPQRPDTYGPRGYANRDKGGRVLGAA
jgi:flagellar biosynthesis/type III secretory pathway chaperone